MPIKKLSMKNPTLWLIFLILANTTGFPQQSIPQKSMFLPVADSLLNIDFGAHLNPSLPKGSGPLAIGKNADDIWNVYSRDGASMFNFLPNNTLENLVWSDGTPSTIRLAVTNAAGAWETFAHHDPMFRSYLYRLNHHGNILTHFSNLPAGEYDIYFYAHGELPHLNAGVEVSTTGKSYGEKFTSTSATWDSAGFYAVDNHYVLFPNVSLARGETLNLTVKPGVSGPPVMNAAQLIWKGDLANTAPVIIQQPDSLTVGEGGSASLSVRATSALTMQFQWYLNGAPLPGVITPVLTIYNLRVDDAGTYTVAVSNSDGTTLSAGAVLHVTNSIPSGTLNFANGVAGFVNAPITNHLGFLASGVNYLAQLYAGASVGTLQPVGAAVPFGTGAQAGFFSGGTRTVSGINPGSAAIVQVRAWSSTSAPTYEQAANRGGPHGASAIIPVLLGGGGSPATLMTGLMGFSLASLPEISTQPEGSELLAGASFQLSVKIATTGALSFQWFFNGTPFVGATNESHLISEADLSNSGTYTVEVENAVGAVLSQPAVVTVLLPRVFFLPQPAPIQEGSHLTFPILVRSDADISAVTLKVSYSSMYFADPEFAWAAEPIGVLALVNTNTAGEIRASFALPGLTLPGGTNPLATVRLRVKSIPQTLTTPIGIEVLGVYGADGSALNNSVATGRSVELRKRKFIGDNNANDRLDVGDASVMLRFVTLLEPLRQWDVPANDLNQNSQLDAGDVIRVLRAVVELDPQPGPANGLQALARQTVEPSFKAEVTLAADKSRVSLGDKLKVRVRLQSGVRSVSGASFRLRFPPHALWLDNASAIQIGSLVSPRAVTLWNLAPGQNNFDLQSGILNFAVSSASTWTSDNGELLEVTFTVQEGVADQASWLVGIDSIDIADGQTVTTASMSELIIASREPTPVKISEITRTSDGTIRFSVAGEIGTIYRVEVSDDLLAWSILRTELNTSGTISVVESETANAPRRFYRVVHGF
jgi:hypothetical protein